MPNETKVDFNRYESYRLQLAEEVGRRFFQAAKRFPGVYFQFLQADRSMGCAGWSQWISENRTADENHEYWDVYPAGWDEPDPTIEDLKMWDGHTSAYCGLYRSEIGNLKAARTEFEQLASTGMKILFAIKRECQQTDSLRRMVELSYLCPGYRGWLDAVRNTAELHRSAYINTNPGIWDVERDMLSTAREAGRQAAEMKFASQQGQSSSIGVFAVEITPDIFTACGNAVRLWLEGGLSEPIEEHFMYDFDPISLPGTGSSDRALASVNVENTPPLHGPVITTTRPKKKRGKLPASEDKLAEDRKIYEAWLPRTYRTYEEFARELGQDGKSVRLTVDRERKRRERSSETCKSIN